MEKDTVTLSLREYQKLYNFFNKMNEDKCYLVCDLNNGDYEREFITNSNAVKMIAAENKNLNEAILNINKDLEITKLELNDLNKELITAKLQRKQTILKDVGIWEFIKFKIKKA